MSAQTLQGVCTHEEREVREGLDEGLVVPSPVDHQLGHAEPESRVGGGADGDPVIRLGGGRTVFGSDDDDFGAALHALDEPVGIGQLVLDQILSIHNDELG